MTVHTDNHRHLDLTPCLTQHITAEGEQLTIAGYDIHAFVNICTLTRAEAEELRIALNEMLITELPF